MSRLTTSLAGCMMVFAAITTAQAQTATTDQSQVGSTAGELSLFIMEQCQPLAQRGRCELAFVQVPVGTQPTGKVSQTCASGWLAHVTAERGTVERGGVNRGQAVVCGHVDAQAAIRGALAVCDAQTFGICQDADHVDIQWAYWSATDKTLRKLAINTPLPIVQLPEAAQCASVVPLVESASCPPAAAVLLRRSGLR